MTVKELKEELSAFDDDAEVVLMCPTLNITEVGEVREDDNNSVIIFGR